MLVRATLILIALFVGGWMVFDGIHVLIFGRFFGPEKPGPWSAVVSSIGLNPLRFGVPFLLLGILWLLFVVAMQYQFSWAWYGALFVAIATLWFLPIGTLFSAIYIVLLLIFRSKLQVR